MRYYKILQDNNFIGIANSNNFIAYQDINHMFISANEETGDLVACNNQLYRDYWMKPFNASITRTYEFASIIEITYEEYKIFKQAIDSEQEIIVEDDDYIAPPITPIIIPEEEGIDYIRTTKIKEMSYTCNKTIEDGFDLEMEDGSHHYSYALEDQLNLMNLSSMIAQGINELSYHADGELCRFYTPAEINRIIDAGNKWKTYHTTYFNALKSYINSLETIEEISAITYGIEIPEAFKTDVLKILEY